MADFLTNHVRKNDLVVISGAISNPSRPALLNFAETDRAALSRLAGAVASVGGTRHLFNTSGRTPFTAYSLVGWGGAGEGNGEETSAVKDPKPGDSRLRGALTPDHQSLFKPTTVSAVDQPPDALAQLLLQPATPWPLDGDAGAQRAISYIGSQDSRLGTNPRAAYWTQPFDQATWDQIAGDVKDLQYPGDGEGFNRDDFEAARRELGQEMTWVGRVRAYLKNLSSPFADTGLASWANLTTIADKVKDALKPPDQRGAMLALDIVGGVLSIGGVAFGAVAEVISITYEFPAVPDAGPPRRRPGRGHRKRQRARRGHGRPPPGGAGQLPQPRRHHRRRLRQAEDRGPDRRLRQFTRGQLVEHSVERPPGNLGDRTA